MYDRILSNHTLVGPLSDRPRKIAEKLFKSLQTHFKNLEMSSILLVSTFLDPRYKNIGFSGEMFGEKAKTLMIHILISYIDRFNNTDADGPEEDNSQESSTYDELSIWGEFDKQASQFRPVQGNDRSPKIS
ncbi:unnamed protein product [Psylliodes chrysocephalus]|uniref:Uncharacterized protein n=1 Tax=Psylliodes chrysocephalus TaxID=3402493 RepID=A0A9P0GLK3_9CUCU|nr:unnamed protein product [Psylliodes chrysocephala]